MNKSSNFVGQHIFSQILSLSSKDSLSKVFRSTSANKWYKSIKAWDHYVTMMFATLSGCTSLNEIVMGLEAFGGKLNHLNINKVPPRSTLADANKNRSSEVFSQIYQEINDYKRFKGETDEPEPIYLNESELERFENFDAQKSISQQKSRDVFVFQCYTGQRIGDVLNMKKQDIRLIDDGPAKEWVLYQ